jgi:hypothetical protein
MTDSRIRYQLSRRQFLRTSALATIVAALAANTLAPNPAAAHSLTRPVHAGLAQVPAGDLDILNYALTLEHLEARAYADVNRSGLLSGAAADYFRDFGAHEAAHVDVLTQTIRDLGGTPVQAQAQYNFPQLNSQQEVLEYFQVVEELGAAAYLGQAPRLVTPDLITAAVSIHNVEGQHAAVLNDLLGLEPSPAFASPKSMEEVLMIVSPILMPADTMPNQMPSTGGGGLRQPRGYVEAV